MPLTEFILLDIMTPVRRFYHGIERLPAVHNAGVAIHVGKNLFATENTETAEKNLKSSVISVALRTQIATTHNAPACTPLGTMIHRPHLHPSLPSYSSPRSHTYSSRQIPPRCKSPDLYSPSSTRSRASLHYTFVNSIQVDSFHKNSHKHLSVALP